MKKILKSVFLLSIIVLSAFLLSGCTASQEEISQYNRDIADSDILIEGKEYTLAIDKLSNAAEVIPNRIDAFERIIDIFILKNRLEDATKIVEESGGQLNDEDKAKLYVSIGDAYYRIKEYQKSLYNYQLAKGMYGDNQRASLGIAKSYLQNGEIEKSRSMLNENYEGDFLIESTLLFSYIQGLNDTQQALESVQSVEPGDDWRELYLDWIDVLESLDEDELFNGAKLGKEYCDKGYPYLAIALLEPKLDKMGEYIDGVYILGKAYSEFGDYQKSIDVLENASSLGDLNQYIYWVLARDYNFLDDINSSISYYDNAISYGASQTESSLYIEYLNLLMDKDLTEKALEVVKNAEKISKGPWVSMYFLKIYSMREDNEMIIYHINKISYDNLEEEEKREFLFLKASFLIATSKLDEAQETLDAFWELDPYDARYNLLSAKLNQENGQLDEAREFAKKAIEYDLEGEVSKEAQSLLAQID